jgi:hypothetical protein
VREREREREREKEREMMWGSELRVSACIIGKRVLPEKQKIPSIKSKEPYYKSKRASSEHTLNPATHTHTYT